MNNLNKEILIMSLRSMFFIIAGLLIFHPLSPFLILNSPVDAGFVTMFCVYWSVMLVWLLRDMAFVFSYGKRETEEESND